MHLKQKVGYHHGDLKEALVQAAYTLVSQNGAENFLLSEACRLAGVSTAAPYKHFKDRDEILEIVVARAFDELAERLAVAVAKKGDGTREGVIAMGEAYVNFAADEQRLFRLMFGQHPRLKKSEVVVGDGRRCFTGVIEHVARYCVANEVPGDPRKIAIKLWTFVHGAASLLIDEDFTIVAPDLDITAMIKEATPLMLGKERV